MRARKLIPIGLVPDTVPGMALGMGRGIGAGRWDTMDMADRTVRLGLVGTVDMAASARVRQAVLPGRVRHPRLMRLRSSGKNTEEHPLVYARRR